MGMGMDRRHIYKRGIHAYSPCIWGGQIPKKRAPLAAGPKKEINNEC